jgi:6-phosphogluconolactonase (cycloisomerase 2 family)
VLVADLAAITCFAKESRRYKESAMRYQRRNCFSASIFFTLTAVLASSSSWAQSKFLFINDDQTINTVSAFSVSSDGTLTAIADSPFATGGTGSAGGGFIASNRIGVAGTFLFASNAFSNNVSVFAIDSSSGRLAAVAGSPFATGGDGGDGIAVSPTPDGKFLMAANSNSSSITVFSVASNGALTRIASSPFATVSRPDGIKVTPNSKFLAVAEPESNQVEMFRIASNGSLTSLGTFAGGGTTLGLAGVDVDCSTEFLYAGEANLLGQTIVDAYSIAPNGNLTRVTGSPFIPGVGSNSNVVLLSPDDNTLFVSNQESNSITVFSVASNGSLNLLSGSPFSIGVPLNPLGMATSQDGTLLYVAGYFSGVSVFGVAKDGTLRQMPGSPFSTGQSVAFLSPAAYPPKVCVLTVGIKIKPPASAPVPINPGAKGKIPVAILSTLTFNAVTDLNTGSLTFGHTGNEASLDFCDKGGEDVNGDGLADLVCHFKMPQAAFVSGDAKAFLKGETFTRRKFEGSEDIRTVPKNQRSPRGGQGEKSR